MNNLSNYVGGKLKQSEKLPDQPYRNRSAGRALQAAGFIIGFMGIVFILGSSRYDEAVDLVLYGLAGLFAGYYVWFRGTRIASVSAEQLMTEDKRDPVVFIRSFNDEDSSYRIGSLLGLVRRAMLDLRIYNRIFQAGSSMWSPMLQFQFNRLFSEIGPFIAIGRPGEKIPGIGAARMYVSDEDWKDVISGFFRRARLVVVQPGVTSGLKWEINEIKRFLRPEKILFILPEKEAEYKDFCSWINSILPVSMPVKMPSARFLSLDSQWKPYGMGGYRMLLDTLEPYLLNNGIRKNQFSLLYRMVYNSWIFSLFLTLAFLSLLFAVVAVFFP